MKFYIKLATQPLIQFLLLGTFIFVIDWQLTGNPDNPRSIIIDDQKYAEIAGIFEDNQGRAPTAAEMETLTIKWAQNEVLYREAKRMELDKGDDMIRQRLILKFRNVLFNKVVTEEPSEQKLRDWFAAHRQNYDKPEKVDFEQFRLTDQFDKQQAHELAVQLGNTDAPPLGFSHIRRYRQRPKHNIESAFGSDDAMRLWQSPVNQWVAVTSPSGWHLSRITSRFPGQAVDYDAVRKHVLEDWKAQTMQSELGETLSNIASNYDIRIKLAKTAIDVDPQDIIEQRLAQGIHN